MEKKFKVYHQNIVNTLSLYTPKPKDFQEISMHVNPPAMIKTTAEAILVILGEKDVSWKHFVALIKVYSPKGMVNKILEVDKQRFYDKEVFKKLDLLVSYYG